MTESKTKSKSVALAMVVSMVVANPLFATGCQQRQPKIVVDEEQMEKEEEQQKSSGGNFIFSGNGRYNSPFIFNNSIINSSDTTGGTISSAGWKTWTTDTSTSIRSGSYSGVRMSSLSS